MKRYRRASVISCAMCDDWSVDVTPWISGRVLTWPEPVAYLMFRWHRWSKHRDGYTEWREHYDREHGQ